MARYSFSTPWVEYRSTEVAEYGATPVTISLESAQLTDNVTLTRYSDGGHRVRINGKAPKGTKHTFKGESAWSDAERLYRDLVFSTRRAQAGL